MKQREKQARLKNIVTTLLVILLVTVFFKKWSGSSASDVKSEPEARQPAAEQTEPTGAPDLTQHKKDQPVLKSVVKSEEKTNLKKKAHGTSFETPDGGERQNLSAQQPSATEGGGGKSRLLELYPSMKGQSLFNILGKMSVSEFPAKEGTVKNEGLAEDGTTVVEYESTDGSSVTQWYSEDGSVGAETIQFSDQEKVTRWFSGTSSSASMVQYDNGQKGGLLYLDGSGDPRTLRTWRSETDPETRIDF